jgi:hypothetical protein
VDVFMSLKFDLADLCPVPVDRLGAGSYSTNRGRYPQ